MIRNLTSEGVESNPGPRHFATKKVVNKHRITEMILLDMEETLLESNARPIHILPIFFHQLKESDLGNLLILIMY